MIALDLIIQVWIFRTSFPQFYSTVQWSTTHEPRSRKRNGNTLPPVWIKDTWTHDFAVLSSTADDRTPPPGVMQQLQNAGLGKTKIVFKDKNGGFNHLRETLETEFPKLKTQRGAFELKADRRKQSPIAKYSPYQYRIHNKGFKGCRVRKCCDLCASNSKQPRHDP